MGTTATSEPIAPTFIDHRQKIQRWDFTIGETPYTLVHSALDQRWYGDVELNGKRSQLSSEAAAKIAHMLPLSFAEWE